MRLTPRRAVMLFLAVFVAQPVFAPPVFRPFRPYRPYRSYTTYAPQRNALKSYQHRLIERQLEASRNLEELRKLERLPADLLVNPAIESDLDVRLREALRALKVESPELALRIDEALPDFQSQVEKLMRTRRPSLVLSVSHDTFPWPPDLAISRTTAPSRGELKGIPVLEKVGRRRDDIHRFNAAFALTQARTVPALARTEALKAIRANQRHAFAGGGRPTAALEGIDGIADRDMARLAVVLGRRAMRDLPPEMLTYACRVARGMDYHQAGLYADLLLTKAFVANGRHARAVSLAKSLPSFATVSPEEASTLAGVFREIIAGSNTPTSKGSLLPLLDQVLDVAPAEASVAELVAKIRGELLQQVGPELHTIAAQPSWRQQRFLEDAAGFAYDADVIDYYVASRQTPYFRIVRHHRRTHTSTLLEREAARTAFIKRVDRTVREASTADLPFVGAFAHQGGYVVRSSRGHFRVARAELAALEAGRPLSSDHPLHVMLDSSEAVVLYGGPLAGTKRARTELDRFGYALQQAYPSKRIIRDEYTADTRLRASELVAKQVVAENVVAIQAPTKAGVIDFNVLRNLQHSFEAAKIPLIEFCPGTAWGRPPGQLVIVISGHSSKELASYVRHLGDAGVFRGNFVVFGACGTKLTADLVTEINSRYGAVGTQVFSGEIEAQQLGGALRELTEQLRNTPASDLMKLMRDVAARNGLRTLWNICELRWKSHVNA